MCNFDFGPFLVFRTRSKAVKKGLKGTNMVNQSVFEHFGPFQTKIDFLTRGTSAKPYFVHWVQKIHCCLKWSKGVPNFETCPNYKKGSKVEKIIVFFFGDILYLDKYNDKYKGKDKDKDRQRQEKGEKMINC